MTTNTPDTPVAVFKIAVASRDLNGYFYAERQAEVLQEICNHLDGMGLLAAGASWTIVITNDEGEATTITVSRASMTRAELDALPEWDGW